jgi:hypothetical protein
MYYIIFMFIIGVHCTTYCTYGNDTLSICLNLNTDIASPCGIVCNGRRKKREAGIRAKTLTKTFTEIATIEATKTIDLSSTYTYLTEVTMTHEEYTTIYIIS